MSEHTLDQQISLNRLVMPWPARLHPDRHEHALDAEAGPEAAGLLATGEALSRFRAFVRLDGYVYPHLSRATLDAAGAFNHWLYFLDDQIDDHPELGHQLDEVRLLMRRAFEVLVLGRVRGDATPFERFTVHVREQLRDQAFDGWMPRFLKHVHDYLFEGSLKSMAVWRSGRTPRLDEYYRLRTYDSGTYAVIQCSMLACEAPLPSEVLEHPLIAELELHANRHVSFANDLFSFQKEVLRQGYPCNLVHVVAEEHGLPLRDAVESSIDLVNAELNAFEAARLQLPEFGDGVDEELARWILGMQTWMRGNLDYSLRSRRFNAPDSPFRELRHTRTISMEIPLV